MKRSRIFLPESIYSDESYFCNYSYSDGNQPVVTNWKAYPTNSIPYTVVAVYSADKSSIDDLSVRGTH